MSTPKYFCWSSVSSWESPTIFSGAMVKSTWLAVWPDGAIRSMFTGTSTVRPAESVNSLVSAEAVSVDAAWSDSPPPDEQPVTANARPSAKAMAAHTANSQESFLLRVPMLPFLSL